jgi:SAM-dependent methyltransferase
MWHGGLMPGYARFARFYDAAMDDPAPRADRVIEWIGRHQPDAVSLLELGCGTGSILARLNGIPSLTGLDRSPEMLAVASHKVPRAHLFEGDMESFRLGQRFDVVACIFDSLNHLLTFDAWQSMFRSVYEHLQPGGLFIFDVNTMGELRRLGDEPPWVYDFELGVLIMDVTFAHDGGSQAMSQWDIRIFEHLGHDRYDLHREQIGELGVELSLIRSVLDPNFDLLEQADEIGAVPTEDSVKAHFAYRRR